MTKQKQISKEIAVYKPKYVIRKGSDNVHDPHAIITLLIRCVFFRNEGAI